MVQENELWVNSRGDTQITGFRHFSYPYFNVRRAHCRPVRPVDPTNPIFVWVDEELRILGYEPQIDSRGNVTVDLPFRDKYGPILKKIAWAYYVALHEPQYTPLTQTQLTREAR